MAKPKPPAEDAATVNSGALIPMDAPAINAAPVATPENTSIPGGGRWAWDYTAACWVDKDAPATPATNPTQPE